VAPLGGYLQTAITIAKYTGGLFPFTHSLLLFLPEVHPAMKR